LVFVALSQLVIRLAPGNFANKDPVAHRHSKGRGAALSRHYSGRRHRLGPAPRYRAGRDINGR
jgi:hypothetical protein